MAQRSDFEQHSYRELVEQIVRRASSSGYEIWWSRVASSGYCSSPVQLVAADGTASILVRCKNRRAAVCPSCSDLYAGDTWQLIHAGLGGGHGVAASVSHHPAVFCTITAPGFGAVHSAPRNGTAEACRARPIGKCLHGINRACLLTHSSTDGLLGQPLCMDCYDYVGQALFTWHAPELWGRFTIALRRIVGRESRSLGDGRVRVSFVKIVEMQRRGVPHFHFVVRLDDGSAPHPDGPSFPRTSITPFRLAQLVVSAAGLAHLEVPGIGGQPFELRFGDQIDAQPLIAGLRDIGATDPRRVAGYLAKYVTKSVSDFGLAPRRIVPHLIEDLDVSSHTKQLLRTVVRLSQEPGRSEMVGWLHTLGYRGHISSKSRRYSTTMGALRATRAEFQRLRIPSKSEVDSSDIEWEFAKAGHATFGDRMLATSKALQVNEARWARKQLVDIGEREEP